MKRHFSMLQFLLNEHLPGYCLPWRRLSRSDWSIDTSSNSMEIWGYVIDTACQRYDVIAIKPTESILTNSILCSTGKEYLTTFDSSFEIEHKHYLKNDRGWNHCAFISWVRNKSSKVDIDNYLI